mgnify:CR=1 FL=1
MQRYLALDALRGLTIALMILVNTPGSWEFVYSPLLHASWHGVTPTDFVFPFFLFIVGSAMYFAFKKQDFTLDVDSAIKVVKRSIIIFLIGLALNAYPFTASIESLRIMGVLQRIGIAYVIAASLVMLLNRRGIFIISVIILLVYWGMLLSVGEAGFTIESNIIRALFEGLCVEDPKKDGNSLPGVAESWTHTDDFKIWTFNLRSSNRWSDGKPLTTDDFLFSYERILSPKFAAKYAGLLYLIEGAEQFNKGETSDFSTVGVKAINPHTLEIRLKAPTPFLPELTKHYTWYPVPKHAVLRKGKIDEQHTNWTDLDNIVSNGPFQLKSWQFNYLIEVEKNQQYWDTNVVKLNGIKFLPVSNQYTENRMFAANQLHVTATIPAEMIEYSKASALFI